MLLTLYVISHQLRANAAPAFLHSYVFFCGGIRSPVFRAITAAANTQSEQRAIARSYAASVSFAGTVARAGSSRYAISRAPVRASFRTAGSAR